MPAGLPYFAWIEASETVFGPEHQRWDENVFSFTCEQGEDTILVREAGPPTVELSWLLDLARVLVKGERPEPKPGRADDFSWPRVEPPPIPEPPAAAGRRTPPRATSPKAAQPRS